MLALPDVFAMDNKGFDIEAMKDPVYGVHDVLPTTNGEPALNVSKSAPTTTDTPPPFAVPRSIEKK